ncbi:N-6 DNA methylase [Nitrospira japonica]|uniref:site-specific DNA-methyltransferase (adenine-specific) n=1 Tax=Nitrospira japonica TaxID=1325564 RepID=A0A1W1I8U7_9BACT|nr:N-6 DNA methylase [Nitrospira japonica]SLM49420.1 N-6 DNA methylase [Nitrospira japonica]
MLDIDTKRRIDTARDILVGKVPDPKSQVEQITIALIYKFMDDMDAEAEVLGGKRKFFSGDFARYGWAKLMRSGLGGHETLALYAEAVTKMPENPGIPLLFREIFKNAFLPYRDPETLKAFLKVIDEFEYDHSERLGDAFEYLLSVLGSQGDAGQFRTPRHIIDFIVAIIAPKKHETVLDPACGTAGFLISSYKHILKTNTDKDGHSTLTPDERGRLAVNFKGYDISPDMVRLSLVNLYLHGFTDPHVYEYDTLTSQDRWNEYADVILANPPFMSPKGGIKPHNRFSVQSKRSEVLFVDYMAEHLTPNGRAGIIVPEGVIFQSQTAYTQLRKMLVEDYLIAVVSLPAGVFNPYSGVKTSILILDKALAKQTGTIAFFKIENDGFGLGAQRRPIGKNDLPQARAEIIEYLRRLCARVSVDGFKPALGLLVQKEKIASNGDYNLSGERYRENGAKMAQYPHKQLGEICEVNPTQTDPQKLFDGWFNYIDISCVENDTGKFLGANKLNVSEAPSRARRVIANEDVLLSTVRPNLRAFTIISDVPERAIASTGFSVLRAKPDRLIPQFLIQMLRGEHALDQMVGMMGKGAYPSINQTDVETIEIPLPPLEVQKEIVADIEAYQKVIDGARAVLDNYRPHIPIHPNWPMVEFPEVVFFQEGPGIRNWQFTSAGIKLLNVKNIVGDRVILENSDKFISAEEFDQKYHHFQVEDGDIIMASSGATYGKNAHFIDPGYPVIVNTSTIRVHPRDESRILQDYIKLFLDSDSFKWQIDRLITGSAQPNFGPSHLKQVKIPLPPLATQEKIVAEIEAEQALVNANHELVARMEKKIQATLDRVWGEDTEEGVP